MVHQKDIDLFSVNCANVINGQIGFCACHSCGKLSGDCDFDYQCQEGLICGTNNCPETFGFDGHTDCCDTAILGDDDFCTTDKLCDINQGDCDSNDECKNHLFCGSNNCPFLNHQECIGTCGKPDYKGDYYCDDDNNNCGCEWDGGDCCGSNVLTGGNVLTDYCSACECLQPGLGINATSVDCCESKGDKSSFFISYDYSPYNLDSFFQILTESCANNYCQDGLIFYLASETQAYTDDPIYGHYKLQSDDVNGRPYFEMNVYGFWYDPINGLWWIGSKWTKGQSMGIAFIQKDTFCPHQLSGFSWAIQDRNRDNFIAANKNHIGVTCNLNLLGK